MCEGRLACLRELRKAGRQADGQGGKEGGPEDKGEKCIKRKEGR